MRCPAMRKGELEKDKQNGYFEGNIESHFKNIESMNLNLFSSPSSPAPAAAPAGIGAGRCSGVRGRRRWWVDGDGGVHGSRRKKRVGSG